MNLETFRRYAQLQDEKKGLKDQLGQVEEELKALQPLLLEEMDGEGLDKLTVTLGFDGEHNPIKRTIFPRREIWAGHANGRQALCDALKEAGLDDFVSEGFNVQTLSAFVRSYDPLNTLGPEEIVEQLPETVREHIKVSEKRQLRVNRG